MFNKKVIYLDHASATPLDNRVSKLMSYYDKNFFANPTSIHSSGVMARNTVEESREKIAKGINAHSDEIIFTGSSTESNAMAILGIVNNKDLANLFDDKKIHIITSNIEHPAVLMNFDLLEKEGKAQVTYIKVDNRGIINPNDVRDAIKDNTALISIMYANNEIGTIQPIKEIAKEIRHYKKSHNLNSIYPLFHTDATQAINYLDISNVEKLGVDMMSFNSSKIYGPKGIGVLFKKRGVILHPIYTGGEQEFGLRSGTENVSSIAGFALAFELTNKIKDKEVKRLTTLRDYTFDKLLKINKEKEIITFNGDLKDRLPNNINISVKGLSSELLVIELDAKGIQVSSKSACKSGDEENASYVIKAIKEANGENLDEQIGSLRITLGRSTNRSDIDKFIFILRGILKKYKKWEK